VLSFSALFSLFSFGLLVSKSAALNCHVSDTLSFKSSTRCRLERHGHRSLPGLVAPRMSPVVVPRRWTRFSRGPILLQARLGQSTDRTLSVPPRTLQLSAKFRLPLLTSLSSLTAMLPPPFLCIAQPLVLPAGYESLPRRVRVNTRQSRERQTSRAMVSGAMRWRRSQFPLATWTECFFLFPFFPLSFFLFISIRECTMIVCDVITTM
jgi:hypothetical protein